MYIGRLFQSFNAEIIDNTSFIKGRGAQSNPVNPFTNEIKEFSHQEYVDEDNPLNKTKYLETFPKSIVNSIPSPDVPFSFGINPYQGCEHGCVYCYARNTHPYWGYSAGLDFERVILVKKSAPELLRKKLSSKSWNGDPIMFAGNTDCYQPIEKKLEITRQLLEVFLEFKNPVALISKNKLMLRDLDILQKLHEHQLLKVSVSLNTINDSLRQKLEPRASSVATRLQLIQTLSSVGIPVRVMAAPIIPGLNDAELFSLVQKVAELGAVDVTYIIVRLNGDVKQIFEEWLEQVYPDRKQKVMNLIAEAHGGTHNDSRFGMRMRGEGKYIEMIAHQFKLAKQKFFGDIQDFPYNRSAFQKKKYPQLDLFN